MDGDYYTLLKTSVVIIVLVTIVVAKIMSKSKKHLRLPPVVKARLPLIGTLIRFMKGPIPLLQEEYPKLGSVFTVKLLHKNITFLIGPEVSAHFFNAFESDLSQKEIYKFTVPTFGPGIVFDVDYAIRLEQFRFFFEAFKNSKLRGYVDQMTKEIEVYFSKWGETGEVDLKNELEQLITVTASRCILGRQVRDKLVEDVSTLFHELDKGMQPITILFPYLPIPSHNCRDRARAELGNIFSKLIATRKSSGDKSEKDLLQHFLDSKYKDGRELTESEVSGLLITGLFAGQHTSAITATWTGAHLMQNKHYLSNVLDEQKKLIGKHGDKLDYDVLSEMDALFCSIKEALRLHPPKTLLFRTVHNDFSVTTPQGKQYNIPKGHIVATSPHFANRLPYLYKDPENFDPDRFAKGRDEAKAAGPCSYLSLGAGRHECPGGSFAFMQIKAVWSYLLRNFELESLSPFPEINWNAMVVGPKGRLMVRYKRRQLS